MGFFGSCAYITKFKNIMISSQHFCNPDIEVESKHKSAVLPMLTLKPNEFMYMLTETQSCEVSDLRERRPSP